MNYRVVIEQAENHVELMYNLHTKPELLYHNLTHTKNTVKAVTEIGNHYELNDRDFFVVITAAWFHDIGYLDKPEGHEHKSAEEAATFLTAQQVSSDDVEAIRNCILATKIPQSPHNFLEEIICDADLFHFGTNNFTENNKLMRREAKILYHKDINKEDWRNKTIWLLSNHTYFTDYCRNILNKKKQEHLNELLAKQKNYKQAPADDVKPNKKQEVIIEEKTEKPEEKPEDKPVKKKDRPERGIETMFRITSSNSQRLSDMADNKSHILITVNSIIISVVVSLLLRKLDANQYLMIPAILLLLVSLVTIVLAILATRPNIPNGTFTQQDMDEKKTNLLFFGNFYNMNLENYSNSMEQVMNDREFLYGTLIRDIYFQGIVLGRKYKLLRAAYNIFMFGLIVSVVAFILAVLLTPSTVL